MGDKHHATGQPDNPQNPHLESVGRSIADDLIIETLVQVIRQHDAMPLAKAQVNLLAGSGSTFDKYLERRLEYGSIRRYDSPSNREEYEVRLKHINQALKAVSSSRQTSQPPRPISAAAARQSGSVLARSKRSRMTDQAAAL